MNVQKSMYFILFFFLTIILFGCAHNRGLFGIPQKKPDLSKDLVTINYEKFFGTKPETRLYVATRNLPRMLQQDTLTANLTKAVNESFEKGKTTRVYVTKHDLLNTYQMMVENFGPRATSRDELTRANELFNRIMKYLLAYYTDKEGFIDREGTVRKPPDFKGSIGNDMIGSIVAILWEAIMDSVDMPVFYVMENNNKIWKTRTGKQPSASKYGFARGEPLVATGKKGIDEDELKAIWFLSGLAGDQSMVLSGAAFRLLGDVQLGAVIVAGHFSIGDNETLAKILDEIFLVVGKRGAEFLSYIGFRELTLTADKISRLVEEKGKADTPAVELLVNLKQLSAKGK